VATDIPVVDERTRVDGATLARLTAAKTVTNVALRWIPPFLPTLGAGVRRVHHAAHDRARRR
jgi:hypothetical protein